MLLIDEPQNKLKTPPKRTTAKDGWKLRKMDLLNKCARFIVVGVKGGSAKFSCPGFILGHHGDTGKAVYGRGDYSTYN